MRTLTAILPAVIVVALIIGVTSGGAATPRLSSPATEQSSGAQGSLHASYGILARPALATDALPAEAQGAISDGATAHYGLNRRDTRLLRSSLPDSPTVHGVYLVPGEAGACVVVMSSGGSSSGCSDTTNFTTGETPPIGLIADGKGEWDVIAIVPDGVTRVTALDSAASTRLEVGSNVASAHFAQPPRSVSWVSADGTSHSHEFPEVTRTPSTN